MLCERRVRRVLLLLLICLLALSAKEEPRFRLLVVSSPVADMHAQPSEDSDVVSQAILGSNVQESERQGEWARITTPDQYSGWTPVQDLREINGPYADSGNLAQVENLFANLYRETDVTTHQPVVTVPFETRLEIVKAGIGNDNGWLQVRLPDQRLAWVQAGDVSLSPRPLSIAESIVLARRFLGLPYLWGGRSTYGYDCSGFTQMLVRSRGINMPRDADLQAAWSGAVPVERKELQAGDLLFFGASADKIGHTGMYIGDGEFIHDTTHVHPVVQISRLDDQPWTRLLVAARRIK